MKNGTVSGGERKGSGFASLSSLRLEVFNLLGSFGNSGSVNLWNSSVILDYQRAFSAKDHV